MKGGAVDISKTLLEYLSRLGITPVEYGELYAGPGQRRVLEAVVEELRDYGDFPSIVSDYNDPEFLDIAGAARKDLRSINLNTHSLMVAGALMQGLRKESRSDFKFSALDYLIMALAHDLGKIPFYLVSGVYNSREHQLVSAAKLTEIEYSLFGENIHYGPDSNTINAIKGHHHRGVTWKAEILRKADMEARKRELLHVKPDFRESPLSEWLEPAELAGRIAPYVNRLRGGRWDAFSFRGTVYCRPKLIYRKARELSLDSKVADLRFIYGSEKEAAMREVVNLLRERGSVLILEEKRFAAKFDIRGPFGVNTSVLTPLRGEIFNMLEVEKRKAGYLEAIKYVHLHKGYV